MDRITGKDAKLMMEALASVYTKEEVEQEVISEEVAETELVLENEEYEKLDENLLQLLTRNRTVYRRDPNTGEKIRVQQQRDPNNLDKYVDKKTSGTGDYGYRDKKPGEAGDGTMGNSVRRTGPKTDTAPAAPQKSARQQELDAINADKNLSPMQKWAKANPKLAAAKAERDRTRGTSASTNPMMKDMPGKRPAPAPTGAAAKPAAAAPASTPSAKPAGSPAAQAAAGAPNRKEDLFTGKPIPSAKPAGGATAVGSAAAKPAAAPAPKPMPKPMARPTGARPMGARNRMRMEEVDIFDTIKEYLIGEGATEEEALKQMLTLTDEQRTEILEGSCGSKKKRTSKKKGY